MTTDLIDKYLPSNKPESELKNNLSTLEKELSNGGNREIVRILIKANERALDRV